MESQIKKIIVIGSGVGGLATACLLAKVGHKVTVLEKNNRIGGRASIFETQGYTFDMGPSWYMMPDVFAHFFSLLDVDVDEELTLERLDPSYRIFFESLEQPVDIKSDRAYLKQLFESLETGSGTKLDIHLDEGAFQYQTARQEFMFKNYDSLFDFFNLKLMKEGSKLPLFSTMEKIVNKRFSNAYLQKILQYQTVLLGTSPAECPGIYALMNHIDLDQGIWYPQGGMFAVTAAMERIALSLGVEIRTSTPVQEIQIENHKTTGVLTESGEQLSADIVVSNADLTHTDHELLPEGYSERSVDYWQKRRMTPSGFILYLGVDGEIDSLTHHNLYFIDDWKKGNHEVFFGDQMPEHPSYYVCCPSKSDKNIAPAGKENLFVLVPVAPGLEMSNEQLQAYEDLVIAQISEKMNIPNLNERIEYKRRFTTYDFKKDYNAYKGNALSGMAHTLMQSAWFRPNNKHKKIKDLYYVGAGTNPGIGVPTCLISAEMVFKRIQGITTSAPLESLNQKN